MMKVDLRTLAATGLAFPITAVGCVGFLHGAELVARAWDKIAKEAGINELYGGGKKAAKKQDNHAEGLLGAIGTYTGYFRSVNNWRPFKSTKDSDNQPQSSVKDIFLTTLACCVISSLASDLVVRYVGTPHPYVTAWSPISFQKSPLAAWIFDTIKGAIK